MKLFKKGDIVKCFMYNGDKSSPSEWTGRVALILECLEKDFNPFIDDNLDKEIVAGISGKEYNNLVAKDVRYKAMIGKRIVLCNHLCFLDLDGFIDWQVSLNCNEASFSYF